MYRQIYTHEDLMTEFSAIRAGSSREKAILAIEYDSAHELIAFSDGERHTVVGELRTLCIDWKHDLDAFTRCTFDPAELRRDLPDLSVLPAIGSVRYLYHVLTGKGKKASLQSLREELLEHSMPLQARFASSERSDFDPFRSVAEDARTSARLITLLVSQGHRREHQKYYSLLRKAQIAIGQICSSIGTPFMKLEEQNEVKQLVMPKSGMGRSGFGHGSPPAVPSQDASAVPHRTYTASRMT